MREAMLAVGDGDDAHPAARPADAGVDDREVHRPLGPGPAAAGLPGRRRRGGLRDPARARPAAALRRPEARHRRQPGQLRPPQGRRRRARRARPARELATDRVATVTAGNISLPHRTATAPPSRPTTREYCVNEIRDAILADQLDAVAGLTVPESYRAVLVRKDELDMFEGLRRQGEGPAQVAARRGGRHPRARPGRGDRRRDGVVGELQHRVDVDLRAGLDLRLPRALRPRLRADQAARPALPRGRLRPGRRRPAGRPGREQVEAGRRGRRALPVGRARGPGRPRRHDDGPAAADLGLRDQLRRPGRAGPGQEQPADAQARPPDLGGGRRPRAGQLHRLPPAGQPQRREHEAGRRRPDLGRLRWPGLLRDPDGPQRRRDPGLRRQQPREGRDRPLDGRRAGHRPLRRGLQVLEGREHPGPQGVAAPRARRSAS